MRLPPPNRAPSRAPPPLPLRPNAPSARPTKTKAAPPLAPAPTPPAAPLRPTAAARLAPPNPPPPPTPAPSALVCPPPLARRLAATSRSARSPARRPKINTAFDDNTKRANRVSICAATRRKTKIDRTQTAAKIPPIRAKMSSCPIRSRPKSKRIRRAPKRKIASPKHLARPIARADFRSPTAARPPRSFLRAL